MNQKQLGPRCGWRRRALSLLLAALMTLGFFPGLEGAGSEASAHWADSYLSQLAEWGFIRQNQMNNPDRALTRADFMSIVNKAYGYHEVGETPFEDVLETDWFYDDVGIAYTAKYIVGTSATTASPNNPLTRETAATILGRNMMLEESPGALVDFTDSNKISTWAMGTIKSALEHYLVSGYEDGTFRPQRNVSWGEMAAMVTSLIGTPLQEPGDYSLGGVFGNVTITSPDVTLRDTVISGDLYISGGVGLGGIKLENVTVLGRIIACGTGNSESGGASILLRNVTADEMLIDSLQDNFVSVQADGITAIGRTTVRTSAYIEDNTPEGMGLQYISLEGDSYPEGEEPEDWEPPLFQLAGRIKEAVNRTPNSTVQVGSGTVQKLTIDETAAGSSVIIDRGAVVKELDLETPTIVTGGGDIEHLIVNAPGCDIEMLPDLITIRPGITAVIAGEEMDLVSAAESSDDPRILAGYPQAQDIVPTGLDAAFMTNKPGTVYWAVSSVDDGSIGEDDLIKPPSYGSPAAAHGSVEVPRSNEEVISKVTKLAPGESYYLSAILVDNKGNRSPVKVVSFETPDNTKPAFCTSYPSMSKVSCADSVAVAMPNKDCKLYYVLLPANATAPTEKELRGGNISGALGYGVMDVKKNIESAFRVNDVTLAEQTNYVLYLWLADADFLNKGDIVKLPFKTGDETPPEFIVDPMPNKIQATSVGMTFQLDEDGVVFWVAVPAGTVYPKPEPGTDFETAPQDSDYGKMQIELGMNLGTKGKSGKVSAKGFVNGNINVSGLDKESAYDFYYLAKDAAGNYSRIWKKTTINTLDTNGPKVSQSFSRTSGNDKTKDPLASTDIYLDFTENVRYTGEQGGKGFLELYQDVKNTNNSAEAVNLLAANLWGAITLHQINIQDNSEIVIDETHSTGRPFTDAMTIDYTKATVESLKDGGIRVTFPASGLHLENGSEYYFTIGDVTDNSNNQNEISPDPVNFWENAAASTAAGHNVPPFIVEFATVNLTSPGVATGKGPLERDNSGNPVVNNDGQPDLVSVDMSFRMTPNNTSSVNNMISYDVLLWSDTILSFDLFYRVVDERGNQISTVDGTNGLLSNYPQPYAYTPTGGSTSTRNISDYLITNHKNPSAAADMNGWYYLGNSSQLSPSPEKKAWSGRSVSSFFFGCQSTDFPLLKNLSEDLRYEFVIRFTKLGEYENRDVWNDEVKFHVNVAAGQSNNLSDMGGALTTNMWETYLKRGLSGGAQSIGRWNDYQNQIVDTMELSKPFIDSSLPTFTNQTPAFEPDASKSDSMDIVLNLTSPGTVYYAIGKAEASAPGATYKRPEINTTRKIMKVDLALKAESDAKEKEDEEEKGRNNIYPVVSGNAGEGDLMFVTLDSPNPPVNGNASLMTTYTPWMIGGITTDATNAETPYPMDKPEKDNLLESPTALSIFKPTASNLAGSSSNSIKTGSTPVPAKDVDVGNSATIKLDRLQSNTTYYAYFVIKGQSSDELSHVYLFQFTTPEASKPRIILDPQDDGNMNMAVDVKTQGAYRVFPIDEVSKISIMKKTLKDYAKDGPYTLPEAYEKMTILEALTSDYRYNTASNFGAIDDPNMFPSRDGVYDGVFDEGYSVFDIYANDKARYQIYQLITNVSLIPPDEGFYKDEETEELGGTPPWNRGGSMKTDAPKTTERWQDQPTVVKTGSQIANSKYLFLAFAINTSMTGGNDYQNASFHASDNLQKGNMDPPHVKKTGGIDGYIEKDSMNDSYSGWVEIVFTKNVFLEGAVGITPSNLLAGLNLNASLKNKLSVDNIFPDRFTLHFAGLKVGEKVSFPGGVNYGYFVNQANVPAPMTLDIRLENQGTETNPKIYLVVEWGDANATEEEIKKNYVIQRIPLSAQPSGYLLGLSDESRKLTGASGTNKYTTRTLTLDVGDPSNIDLLVKAEIEPDELTNVRFDWSIPKGNDPVVKLVKEGEENDGLSTYRITALKPGTVTVTVKADGYIEDENGNRVSKTCENKIEVTVRGRLILASTDVELNYSTSSTSSSQPFKRVAAKMTAPAPANEMELTDDVELKIISIGGESASFVDASIASAPDTDKIVLKVKGTPKEQQDGTKAVVTVGLYTKTGTELTTAATQTTINVTLKQMTEPESSGGSGNGGNNNNNNDNNSSNSTNTATSKENPTIFSNSNEKPTASTFNIMDSGSSSNTSVYKKPTLITAANNATPSSVTKPATPSVTLSPSSVSLDMGGMKTATVTASVTNGTASKYTWTSSNSNVVSVPGSGASVTLTAKSIGVATIKCTATVNGKEYSKSITVPVNGSLTSMNLDSSTKASLSGTALTLTRGGGTTPSATLSFKPNGTLDSNTNLAVLSVFNGSTKKEDKSALDITVGTTSLTVKPKTSTPSGTTFTVTVGLKSGDTNCTPTAASQKTFTVVISGSDSGIF